MENENNNLNLTSIRIKQMRLDNGLTQKDLANKLGLKNDTAIANYEAGYSTPKDDIKIKMCEIFNCSIDYLMGNSNIKKIDEEIQNIKEDFSAFGIDTEAIDTMLYQNTDLSTDERKILSELLDYSSKSFENGKVKDIDINEFLGKYALTNKQKDDIIRNYIITLESQVKIFSKLSIQRPQISSDELRKILDDVIKRKNISASSQYYMCPVYGRISAGQPNWAEECIEGRLPIDPDLMGIVNPEEHFFLRVNGESMNKVIKNGAFALIHKQDVVENGEIAVVLVNGDEATIKKFNKQGDLVILEPMSDDSSFQVQVYNKTTPIKVLGKYVGKMEINK